MFSLLESSLPIWRAVSKITFYVVPSSNALRASHLGPENPGGACGRTVGATLPRAALAQFGNAKLLVETDDR